MKRYYYLKKLIVLEVIILVLISCSNNTVVLDEPNANTGQPTPHETTNIKETDSPEETTKPNIDIVLPDPELTIYREKTSTTNLNAEEIEEWERYLYEKYNHSVNLMISDVKYTIRKDISAIKRETDLNGLIFCTSFTQLTSLKEAGLITPVNKYIANIQEYNIISDYIISNYTDDEKNIWAFPFGLPNDILPYNVRFYNDEWLKVSGYDVPVTTDDFYSYAVYIAEEDPDKNGIRDTYIDVYDSKNMYKTTETLRDIWVAFGCYFDYGPIAYNPKTKEIEDFILSENFIEAARYIKTLIDNGYLMDISTKVSGENDFSKIASANAANIRNTKSYKNYSFGFCLEGADETYLINIKTPGTCLAVLKNTENVEEQINVLFDILQSNPESYMDFLAGLKDKNYKVDNDKYELLYADDGKSISRVGLNFRLEGYPSEDILYYSTGSEENMLYMEMRNETRKELKKWMNTDAAYTIPSFSYSDQLLNINGLLSAPVMELFNAIFIRNEDFEESINKYKAETEKIGSEKFIKVLNE